MRSKTTPIWEQHLEKGILALLVVVLLVILFIGLTGSPNQVEVRVRGQARTLSPGELNELILSEANSIRMRQTPDASPMEQPPAVRELRMLSPDVTEVIEGEVLPNDALARTAPMVAGGLVSTGSAEDLLYHLPAPPPGKPFGGQASAGWGFLPKHASRAPSVEKACRILVLRCFLMPKLLDVW